MADKKEKKFLIDNPTLMTEWNWEKNNELGFDPKTLTLGSNKKAWWKCSACKYEWEAKILNRSHGRNCPCCSNKVVVKGKNDLQTTHPELVKMWNWSKNNKLGIYPTEITKGVNKKVWWICPNGHEYQASVLHRSHGTGCPICNSGRQTSFAEQAIFYYIKKYFNDAQNKVLNAFGTRMEFDIYIPSLEVVIEYDGGYWHEKENSKEKELKKYNLCKENGLTLVRIREPEDKDFIQDGYTRLSGETINYSKIKADYVIFSDKTGNNKKLNQVIQDVFNILNNLKSLFDLKIYNVNYDINIERDKNEIYNNLTTEYSKSLKVANPTLAGEFHPTKNGDLTANHVSYNTRRKVWWLCKKCGYEWQSSINLRNKGTGCPQCAIQKNKGKTHAEAKQIFQYSLDGLYIKKWDCISTAGRELKINSSNISMCAKGIRPNAGGFRWSYEYIDRLPLLRKKEKKSRKGLNSKKVAICDANGNIMENFNSLNEAQEKTGVNSTSISKMLNGHIKTAGGYYWRFID